MDVLRVLRPQYVHAICNHHGTFIKMMLMDALRLANAVRRWLQSRYEILEIHPALSNPHWRTACSGLCLPDFVSRQHGSNLSGSPFSTTGGTHAAHI